MWPKAKRVIWPRESLKILSYTTILDNEEKQNQNVTLINNGDKNIFLSHIIIKRDEQPHFVLVQKIYKWIEPKQIVNVSDAEFSSVMGALGMNECFSGMVLSLEDPASSQIQMPRHLNVQASLFYSIGDNELKVLQFSVSATIVEKSDSGCRNFVNRLLNSKK